MQLKDRHWQEYYQERRALDHRYQKACKPYDEESGDEDANKENQPDASEWQEDFPLPDMNAICRSDSIAPHEELMKYQSRVLDRLSACMRGCPGLTTQPGLQEAMKGSFYFLDYW